MPHRGDQGTGRHPQKSAAASDKGHKAPGKEADSSDLKSREYRGEDGEIHHHTRTYERDHPGKSR